VARDDGVGDDDEGLGAKGQLEDAPIFDEPPVQGFEQGLVARQVGQLARGGRDVGAAQVGLEVALTDGCEVDGERERERERERAGESRESRGLMRMRERMDG
jgi:hypothetical protein